jgi:Protein of unknown function (DUF2917)
MACQSMMNVHEDRWTLAPGRVLRLAPAGAGRWLRATAGRLWLTRTGGGDQREADVWLQPGERQWLAPGSEWLIEGEGAAAAFVLLEPPPARSARPASPAAPRVASRPGFPWLRQALSSS